MKIFLVEGPGLGYKDGLMYFRIVSVVALVGGNHFIGKLPFLSLAKTALFFSVEMQLAGLEQSGVRVLRGRFVLGTEGKPHLLFVFALMFFRHPMFLVTFFQHIFTFFLIDNKYNQLFKNIPLPLLLITIPLPSQIFFLLDFSSTFF